jgi:hypothetical protein
MFTIYTVKPVLLSGGKKDIILGWSYSSHVENRKRVQNISKTVNGIKFHKNCVLNKNTCRSYNLSLVRIIEELLEWKNSGSGLENRD